MNYKTNTFVAFLRGINVGGHHKVPMQALKKVFSSLNCSKIDTVLNSGNIIFNSDEPHLTVLQNNIEIQLKNQFGFAIPTILIPANEILQLNNSNPFKEINITNNTRLYISFFSNSLDASIKLPWVSADNSFNIIAYQKNYMLSVLDLSTNKTPKAMHLIETIAGKHVTTRNWNTIVKIASKLRDKS